MLFASTTADSCEAPNFVTVMTGDAECWALLSTALVVCGSASRAGAAWLVLLLCWERFSEKLDGGLATGVVCDFRTLALGCFLCSTLMHHAATSCPLVVVTLKKRSFTTTPSKIISLTSP